MLVQSGLSIISYTVGMGVGYSCYPQWILRRLLALLAILNVEVYSYRQNQLIISYKTFLIHETSLGMVYCCFVLFMQHTDFAK